MPSETLDITLPARPKIASVLFDEAHSEAWTIRPDVAERMQPQHPADSSLAAAAAALTANDFEVAAHSDGALTPDALAGADVLVIPHPSEEQWEHTTGTGSPVLSPEEITVIQDFVNRGGGLIVLGETEEDKYGANLNELLGAFGITIENATVQDYEHHHEGAPSWVLADLTSPGAGPDLLARVDSACFYRAGTLALHNGATPIATTHASADPPSAPLAATTTHGAGRVAVLADSDLFGDDCIDDLGHRDLWLNLVFWAAGHAFAAPAQAPLSAAAENPHWHSLRDAVAELRLTQSPDGSVDTAEHDPARLGELVATIVAEVHALAPGFPHQAEYFDALTSDLARWADDGFGAPDFYASTDTFRPEQHRVDGIEHLVVFPMYKQNASRDTCFEALIIRTPWPAFVAELERTYDNAKFVPAELVDFTDGYDSECAVLFPETFASHERPPAHFGAIFCDREAERLRRVAGSAAEILHLNLPPDAAALLSSPEISRDAFISWDLIHDRTHMRGDLPFDPFMIRQRSPYWMYALEELRCDLTAFGEATKLVGSGFPFARNIQYAILFDRLFRFPLTGNRVRNYDGLGGQLLFAYLHRDGHITWTDNRMSINWDTVADGVAGLHARVSELYRSGIDRSKVAQWAAAHDLVSEFVPPTESSLWVRERRDLPEVEEPKQLVDLVRDDEFPLSLFYSQLQPKLAPALERNREAVAA